MFMTSEAGLRWCISDFGFGWRPYVGLVFGLHVFGICFCFSKGFGCMHKLDIGCHLTGLEGGILVG